MPSWEARFRFAGKALGAGRYLFKTRPKSFEDIESVLLLELSVSTVFNCFQRDSGVHNFFSFALTVLPC